MNSALRDNVSVALNEIVSYLDELLQSSTTPDYPGAVNGLQLSNRGQVTKVAAAVDFSNDTVSAAIAEQANLLIVHHGMFWSDRQPIVGNSYTRLRQLLDADVAVYASHLPLDRHPELGNNVLLAKHLELQLGGQFARFKEIFIGVRGETEIATSRLVERARAFSREHGGETITAGFVDGNRKTRRWAICTGAGASAETLAEAASERIDTLIVGEGPHWTAIEARDRDLVVIYVGHYASETLGIYALGDDLSQRFRLPAVRISKPTGL
ncbi:MAG TPA: Nif3-like dinuclear metal center hexameric protein [Blastocatellia bacterium]|nr:Nif3-like dinuclear metal center hexameric protein [Blastocatellia bacterium]